MFGASLKRLFPAYFLVSMLALVSCNRLYQPQAVNYTEYRIGNTAQQDTALAGMLRPYADSLAQSMNLVIGELGETLEKKLPDAPLGNFMADAMLEMASRQFGEQVDIAVMNYGGIRLNEMPPGPVTRGKIYELMPFDNLLVVQRIRGDQLQAFLDLTAEYGGWPFAGLTMQIRDKKAVNIMIQEKPLDPTRTYLMANSDYVANGGGNAIMLTGIPQENRGYLIRDAIIDYVSGYTAQGKKIPIHHEKRVSYAE